MIKLCIKCIKCGYFKWCETGLYIMCKQCGDMIEKQ